MDNPVKIIHKYKNLNRKVQYNVLIFVGNLLSDNIVKILKKIKDKNLFDTLIELNERELNLMIKAYGQKWYTYFFIDKHIKYIFDTVIKGNESKQQDIIKKYGNKWFNEHIDSYNSLSKTLYSFQSIFKADKDFKLKSSKITHIIQNNFEEDLSYKTQTGGKSQNNNLDIAEVPLELEDQQPEQEGVEIEEPIEIADVSNELAIEDIIDTTEIDTNAATTNAELQNLIEKTELEEKNKNYGLIVHWNELNDNKMYDETIQNTYTKTYIYNQYICIDDTVKIIKNKICAGYEKSKIYDHNSPYFIPTRLYLWGEYEYNGNDGNKHVEKIMIGQKWVKHTELLDIDIEPNVNLRIYETVKGNLKNLQDNIKKYGSRIVYEDDNQLVLSDYKNYISNNEIYMTDIYDDFGTDYQLSTENLKNIYDVYVSIYYHFVSFEDFKGILEYLKTKSTNKSIEALKIINVFRTIENDLINENEILKLVEQLKLVPEKYTQLFKENYIIEAVLHINLKFQNVTGKLDLYKIFDDFVVDDIYPFIQYQNSEGKMVNKFYILSQEKDKTIILSKWFESSPYGINFKVNVGKYTSNLIKYITISLSENGRIDYKTQWNENDHATMDSVKASFMIVKDLIKKINEYSSEYSSKNNIEVPTDDMFKYAFINVVQHFELPNEFLISHNDLSDFARNFYPYVAVVIEPRKRKSRVIVKEDKSKYGTYLRFKRVSNYENESRIENRIVYFLRNYEHNDTLLSLEIAKQFNITEKQALDKIKLAMDRFPNLKYSRKILKKFDELPRYKPPGISIDIQGKSIENYKIRITGARSQQQLDNILTFMNILLYLYIEIYLFKHIDYQYLKDKLKELTFIAKRRHKVIDIVKQVESVNNIKQLTKLDKNRLAYKPEKGQNQWPRNCQNSGENKKRRPIIISDNQIDDLIAMGYEYNNKSGDYEKNIKSKNKNIVLKAAKVTDNETNKTIYYVCDPAENKDFMYVGFLSRSSNPHGLCGPCCFKKDPMISKNKAKKDFHIRCLGKNSEDHITIKVTGDQLYILQNSNKILDTRFGYLSSLLDIYLNTMLNKTKIIKNNYLISSDGWFFKYGSKQNDDIFLTAIGDALGITVDQIKNSITDTLIKNDNAKSIFVSLSNGNIKSKFKTINTYLQFIHTNFEIESELLIDILNIPGVVYEFGINIIIFEKHKIGIIEDFSLININRENIRQFTDTNKANIIIIKEDDNYYPIYQLRKDNISKDIVVDKYYKYSDEPNNIINHLLKFILLNMKNPIIDTGSLLDAKTTFTILEKIKKYPALQIIDKRNKCRYFIMQNNKILPVKSSGALYWLPIIPIEENIDKYISDLYSTSEFLNDIYFLSNKQIKCKPIGISYSSKIDNIYDINAIKVDKYSTVPINNIKLSRDDLIKMAKKYKTKEFITESSALFNEIDNEINSKNKIIDKRIKGINLDKYNREGYELFRLELYNYLREQPKIKNKIVKILSTKIDNETKSTEIKFLLYKIINKKLADIYTTIKDTNLKEEPIVEHITDTNTDISQTQIDQSLYLDDSDFESVDMIDIINEQSGGFVEIENDLPKLDNYEIKNNRETCNINKNKKSCISSSHCQWIHGNCSFRVTVPQIIEYINRIADEIVNNEIKSNELLAIGNYYISDIVNRDAFTIREHQKIIKSNKPAEKLLSAMFGKENIPIIGKQIINKTSKTIIESNIANPLEIIGDRKYQLVHNNNGLYRAIANGYYWNKNKNEVITNKNLGFYNPIQTDLSNYFKSLVMDWISNKKHQSEILNDLGNILHVNKETFITDIKKYLSHTGDVFNNYVVDLYILSKIFDPDYCIYLYDSFDNVIGIFENGIKYLVDFTGKLYEAQKEKLNIKFNVSSFSLTNTPYLISVIYN